MTSLDASVGGAEAPGSVSQDDFPVPEGSVMGGRSTDASGVNQGLIRCPRCDARVLTCCGLVVQRQGNDQSLWVPTKPVATAASSAAGGGEASSETAEGEAASDNDFLWVDRAYEYWWKVDDINDVDNAGLSRLLPSPLGEMKMVMCTDCTFGPFGYQMAADPELWLVCDLLRQQDAKFADDKADFRPPEGIDLASLRAMIESGQATVQVHHTFEEQRLGMMLADAADLSGVEVHAFTEFEGHAGPAELSGKVEIGDQVTRVNGRSTQGLDYAAVLDLIIDAPRPVTIYFERQGAAKGAAAAEAPRVAHSDWRDEKAKAEAGGAEE